MLAVVAAVLASAFVGVAITTRPSADERVFEDPVDQPGCDRGNWPAAVVGTPQGLTENPAAGLYLWLDFEGWHVRAAGGTEVEGTVYVVGPPVNAGGPAGGGVEVQPTTIQFDLDGTDPATGVDFTVNCDFFALTFDVRKPDGEPLPIEMIRVGPQAGVAGNPFTYQRELAQ